MSYRTRIRTPSVPAPATDSIGDPRSMIPDLIAYIASIDFVMADVIANPPPFSALRAGPSHKGRDKTLSPLSPWWERAGERGAFR